MLIGKNMWDENIVSGLTEKTFHQRTYDVYQDVPDNLFASLERTAASHGSKTGIYDDTENGRTYAEFLTDCLAFANYLYEEKGMRKHAHVALMMYNCYEFCVAFYACNRLGVVAVPLPTKYRKDEILSLCEKSDLDGIICDIHFRDWFDSFAQNQIPVISTSENGYGFSFAGSKLLPPEVPSGGAEDTAILMFTSGTTAKCKGVVIQNYSAMHAVTVYRKILQVTDKDTTIIPVPIYYVTGLLALLGLFVDSGGTIYLHKFFDAKRILTTMQEKNVTFFHASPTVFSLLLQESEAYPSLPDLRCFACGSSNMPKEKLQKLHQWLPQMVFHTVYGLTETASPATVFPTDAATHPYIGSSGIPVPGLRLKIINPEGKEASANESGEIWVAGTVVLDHYYHQESTLIQDGWLDTGDIGYINEDGYLFIVDRKKDMINRGGEKICSYDVENELYKIDGISEAAVVGIPDDVYGEVAAAAVKKKESSTLTESDIKEILSHQLAKYKIPVKILFLDDIPLTRNFKVDKQAIRKLFTNPQED